MYDKPPPADAFEETSVSMGSRNDSNDSKNRGVLISPSSKDVKKSKGAAAKNIKLDLRSAQEQDLASLVPLHLCFRLGSVLWEKIKTCTSVKQVEEVILEKDAGFSDFLKYQASTRGSATS